jgi:hypothetical protein
MIENSSIGINPSIMKRISLIAFLFFLIISCERWSDDFTNQYVAQIVGFDLNCSTCILTFPNDSLRVKNLLGESQNNCYQTVNLDKGKFKVGQMIKVNVRKAEDNELMACITLYPSYNYSNIFVSEYEYFNGLTFNDTIYLGYGECISDFGKRNAICFDTVLTDSRCPENLVCVWAGEATVRFKFETCGKESSLVDLYTGTNDTIINGYKFSFIDLLPYPNTENQTSLEDYKAKIILKHI